MTKTMDERVIFDRERMLLEVDLTDLRFKTSAEVNAFYDRIEDRVEATGEELWFVMLHVTGFRVEEPAWYANHKRDKALHKGHSMGTIVLDESPENRRHIEHDRGTENFNPNLFADRDTALARIAELPCKRREKRVLKPTLTPADMAGRVTFDEAAEVMEVDLSRLTITNSKDAAQVFDFVEKKLKETGLRWFFLLNMDGCRIYDEAWISWASRGKKLNLKWSMGTVRYNTGTKTEETIRMRAESQGFRPNVRSDRELALERLAEMKREMA